MAISPGAFGAKAQLMNFHLLLGRFWNLAIADDANP